MMPDRDNIEGAKYWFWWSLAAGLVSTFGSVGSEYLDGDRATVAWRLTGMLLGAPVRGAIIVGVIVGLWKLGKWLSKPFRRA